MKHGRSLGLVVVLLCLSGCGPQREIDQETYFRVKKELQEEYHDRRYWPKEMFIYNGHLNRFERFWAESIRGQRKNLLSRVLYLRTMYKMAQRSCRRVGVSFDQFNQAHVRFGRQDLTYWQQVKEYMVLAPHRRDARLRGEEPEPAILERYIRLTQDMGTELWWEFRVVVEVGFHGEIRVWDDLGRPLGSVAEVEEKFLSRDPYNLVQIMPDPKARAGELFKIAPSMPSAQRVVICDSFYNYVQMFVNLYPLKGLDTLTHDRAALRTTYFVHLAFVEIDGGVYLNSEPIDEADLLGETVEALMERSVSKLVVVAVDDEASCGKVMELVRLLKNNGAHRIAIIPNKLIAGYEPKLDTETILKGEPYSFNEVDAYKRMNQ